jgi:3-hydroxy-5-methyl-1-naphthoate 3-O-methyltransferase
MSEGKPVTPERIMQMAWGYAPPLVLEAALSNRVFDSLDAGPKTVAEVARETGASERGLRAIMNALVGMELLAREGERYALTPESAAFLVSGKPGFHGGLLHHMSHTIIPSWLGLSDTVRTGRPSRPVNTEAGGAEFFRDFVEALFPMGYPGARALAEHLGVERAVEPVRVLDLAAGSGVWGSALAQRGENVRVTAVDWPEVIPVTRRVAERFGLGERFRFLEGDIQQVDFGGGYRIATLGHILHSEGEARSRALLRRVAEALEPGGTIAIAEMIPNDDRTGPLQPLIFAVNMLANTEAGDTFTFAEMSGWLREAGFEEPRLLEAPAPSPLLLATRR